MIAMGVVTELQDKTAVKDIAKLHMSAFPTFFLTQLGSGFLELLYEGFIEDPRSGILVSTDETGLIQGFLAYSTDYSGFFKHLVKKHLLAFAWYAALAALRHPSFSLRLLRAFEKSDEVARPEAYVELSSIAVRPNCESRGVGRSLITHLIGMVDFETYEYISLETDAENNDDVNRFYQNNGFKLERTYSTKEGRKMNEYRYRGSAS